MWSKSKRPTSEERADSQEKFLGVGLYTVSELAFLISHRLRGKVDNKILLRWSRGRRELSKEYAAVTKSPLRIAGAYLFTFTQFIELMTIAALRSKGVKTREIKSAYTRSAAKFGKFPFARESFRTDGVYVYTALAEAEPEELSRGQLFFEEVVKPILMDVSYVHGKAATYSPLGKDKSVILDPDLSFGSPVNRETGVPTSVLYAMSKAGESNESIADWYGVPLQGVIDAIQYESTIRSAA